MPYCSAAALPGQGRHVPGRDQLHVVVGGQALAVEVGMAVGKADHAQADLGRHVVTFRILVPLCQRRFFGAARLEERMAASMISWTASPSRPDASIWSR